MRLQNLVLIWVSIFIIEGSVWGQSTFTEKDRQLLYEIKAKVETNEKRIEDLREDMNARFRLIDKQFEQIDKRFEQIDKRFEQIDKRFDQIDKRFGQFDERFDDMFGFLQILAAIFTAMVVAVIGFAYWDRRTIIKKAKEDTIEEIEKNGRLRDLIHALREKAKSDHELAQLLRDYHLL